MSAASEPPSETGPDAAGAQAARWDARYAAAPAEGLFGDAPNAWLRMALARDGPLPRRALMLADGDGRNGTWLASRGVAVTAVDLSAEATRRAEARDRAAGVRVARRVADLALWRPEPAGMEDLATVLFLHGPEALGRRAVGLAAEALAPGGRLLVEGFATAQAGGAIGPDDPAKLYSRDALAAWAEALGLKILEALEGRVLLDEGLRHQGPAAVARLLARRPG